MKLNNPLLTTKLYRPPTTPDLEQRSRLLERFSQNILRPLTLITAPAGYGKTVLASQWLESCELPSTWLSLDESDNDLILFVSYFLAAISNIFPDLELNSRKLMAGPNLPSVSVFGQTLINDLDKIDTPYVFVIDDIHHIHDPEICDLFELLLQHPPRNLHLVLIGRHDPAFNIISLRASRRMTEIRTLDLGFTYDETAHMMSRMLGREIDSAVAREWTEACEGWVTALRLAVLSLRHRGLDDNLGVRVRGNSRYLREYLLAEVLSRLPEPYQNCLIKISILDRFCAPLCDAICQTDPKSELRDITGEKFINLMESENLFLIPLDDQHEWFRLHHLFQESLLDLLKAQLSAEQISDLQLRASRWYAEAKLEDEALQYALAAGNIDYAVMLVEQNRNAMWNNGQWHRLERWINLFPPSAVEQNPILLSTKAFLGIYFGKDKDILYLINAREHLLSMLSPGTAEFQFLQAEINAIQAIVDMIYGRITSAKACAQMSLDKLPSQALYPRAIATLSLAICQQMEGKLNQSVTLIQRVLEGTIWPAGFHTQLIFYLSIAYFQQGDLNGVLRTITEYIQLVDQYHLDEARCYGWYHRGVAHYLRNEFDQAEPYLLALLENRAQSANSYLTNGIFALALIYHATGRESEANQVIDLLSTHLNEARDSFGWVTLKCIQVDMALRQNNLEQARRLSTGVNFDMRPPYWLFYVPQLTHIKLLLAEGSAEHLEEAHAWLDDLDKAMREVNRNNVRIDVLNLQALVFATQGDEPAALVKLRAALELGVLGGNIRSFVDLGAPMANLLKCFKQQQANRKYAGYLDQILAAFPKASKSTILALQSQLDEPLTNRELEVLALLSQRLSNKEIAVKLVISPRTVKRHTLNIYRKLDVNSRQQAVEKALDLGMLAITR